MSNMGTVMHTQNLNYPLARILHSGLQSTSTTIDTIESELSSDGVLDTTVQCQETSSPDVNNNTLK